jgi:hypothetical protein
MVNGPMPITSRRSVAHTPLRPAAHETGAKLLQAHPTCSVTTWLAMTVAHVMCAAAAAAAAGLNPWNNGRQLSAMAMDFTVPGNDQRLARRLAHRDVTRLRRAWRAGWPAAAPGAQARRQGGQPA